jgi:putative membrane protein
VKLHSLTAVIALGLTTTVLTVAIRAGAAGSGLGPADTYFVTQTSLGTPFQVDSGRLAETRGTTKAIQSAAQLMVSSHITVNNALTAILKDKAPTPPPTLLKAAYSTIVSTLQRENRQTFDADYVGGQVNYQKANAALYQYEIANGTDPDLKAFARQTLPKIQDHLARALKLQGATSDRAIQMRLQHIYYQLLLALSQQHVNLALRFPRPWRCSSLQREHAR